jgi:benzoyl-CoA reductase subunit C
MQETLERCEQIVTDIDFKVVRAWKEAHPGQKAVAYFPVYAPQEIIHAAGMLPVGLHGAGDGLDIQHADARFGSFICSVVKTTLELGMTGHLDCFDGFLFSSICDSARNLCWVFKRNFPALQSDFLHLPHNPAADATVDFLTAEYQRLRKLLDELGGRPITDEGLRQSIGLYNHNRRLLRELYGFRAKFPHLLRTSELYVLMRVGNFIPPEEHRALLEKVRGQIFTRKGKVRDSVRMVVEGSFCEQPPLELIRMVEDSGCYVVDDDFCLGSHWFEDDIKVNGDPWRALADAYLNQSVYSSVRHDFRKPRFQGLIEKVRRRKADAVILLIAKFCEPAYFDYVLFKRELEGNEIPHLLLEFEEKMFTFDRARTEIETFVESLLFEDAGA